MKKICLLFCWFQRTPGKVEQGVLELSFSRTVWRVAGQETRLQLVREMKSRSGYSQTGISQRGTLQGQLWPENSCYLCVTVTQWKKDTLYASAKGCLFLPRALVQGFFNNCSFHRSYNSLPILETFAHLCNFVAFGHHCSVSETCSCKHIYSFKIQNKQIILEMNQVNLNNNTLGCMWYVTQMKWFIWHSCFLSGCAKE